MKTSISLFLFLLSAIPMLGQNAAELTLMLPVSATPTSACGGNAPREYNIVSQQVLGCIGGSWVPLTIAITANVSNMQWISGTPINCNGYQYNPVSAQIYACVGGSATPITLPAPPSTTPSGAAGGALAGTYPNPTLIGVVTTNALQCAASAGVLKDCVTDSTVPDLTLGAIKTSTNCSSSASPAVCAASAAGSVVIAAAATSVVVNTTAVTANSQIVVTEDQSLGTKLSVTCNTQSDLVVGAPVVSARTPATSFTIAVPIAPTATPICFSYQIIN